MITKLKGFIDLSSPHLFVVPGSLGVCGVFLSNPNPDAIFILFGVLIPTIAWAGGQVFSNLFDSDFDRIKHPTWPIPSGTISKKEAATYGLLLYSLCLIFAYFLNIYCFSITLISLILATFYGYLGKLKQKGFYRNFCFGLVVASCILIGASTTRNISEVAIFAMIIAILIYTSDNIIGDIPNIEIERNLGFSTLPLQIGPKKSAEVAFILMTFATILTLIFWIFGLNFSYLPLAIIALGSLLWTNIVLIKDPIKFGNLWIIHARYMGQIALYFSFIVGAIG